MGLVLKYSNLNGCSRPFRSIPAVLFEALFVRWSVLLFVGWSSGTAAMNRTNQITIYVRTNGDVSPTFVMVEVDEDDTQ